MGTYLAVLSNLKSGSDDDKYNFTSEFTLENLFLY